MKQQKVNKCRHGVSCHLCGKAGVPISVHKPVPLPTELALDHTKLWVGQAARGVAQFGKSRIALWIAPTLRMSKEGAFPHPRCGIVRFGLFSSLGSSVLLAGVSYPK